MASPVSVYCAGVASVIVAAGVGFTGALLLVDSKPAHEQQGIIAKREQSKAQDAQRDLKTPDKPHEQLQASAPPALVPTPVQQATAAPPPTDPPPQQAEVPAPPTQSGAAELRAPTQSATVQASTPPAPQSDPTPEPAAAQSNPQPAPVRSVAAPPAAPPTAAPAPAAPPLHDRRAVTDTARRSGPPTQAMATPNDLDVAKRESRKSDKNATKAQRKRAADSNRVVERRKPAADDDDDSVAVIEERNEERRALVLEERPANPIGALFGIVTGGN